MTFERRPRISVRSRAAVMAATIVGIVVVAGCSADSEITVPAVQPVTFAPAPSVSATTESVDGGGSNGQVTPTGGIVPPTGSDAQVTAASLIPGLNSTIEFCAAWSRFTGSYTLVAPAWAVSLDPEIGIDVDPAVVEVVAAPTMVTAYFDLGKNWPAEIAEYQAEGMDSYRPLLDRMNRSLNRLKAAGASDDDLAELATWWEDQLATFDGYSFPGFASVPDDLKTSVVAAAEETRTGEVPMVEDPALVSEGVNAVYDYLSTTCPDRGQLAGEDVAATVSADQP